jgi:hypothetical protein
MGGIGGDGQLQERGEEAWKRTLNLMNKNCVKGTRGGVSWHETVKPRKDLCKRSKRQGKEAVPYPGRSAPERGQKSAEAVVVEGVTTLLGEQ